MSFDLAGALRALKPQKHTRLLAPGRESGLDWASDQPINGYPLLLDTCVYIDMLRDTAPEFLDRLLERRICHHSAVCLAELTHAFGRLDPSRPETALVLRKIGEVIQNIKRHRLHEPDSGIWGQAGIVAGELSRRSGLPKTPGSSKKYLNDALIALQAKKLGANVLTANVRDFDYLSQIIPGARVLYYKSA